MTVAVIQMLPDLAADADGVSALGPLFASVELKAPMPADFSVLKFSPWPKALKKKSIPNSLQQQNPKAFSQWMELCQVSWSKCVAELADSFFGHILCELSVLLVAVHAGIFVSRAPGLARRSAPV